MIKPLITYHPVDTSVYLVGSRSYSRHGLYNQELSDTDLLIVPRCDSLGDYVSHFEQAIKIFHKLDEDDEVVDVFFMSERFAYKYFMILPAISGTRILDPRDLIFGEGKRYDNEAKTPSETARRELYKAKAYAFMREYEALLPISDTSMARKVAKRIFQGIKLIICASSEEELDSLENRLSDIHNYKELAGLYDSVTGKAITHIATFDNALKGLRVDDWSLWMAAQERMARDLVVLNMASVPSINTKRYYEGIASVRDLLNRHLKDVISCDDTLRMDRINNFANHATAVIAKLAYAGVTQLEDLDAESCPHRVREAYDSIVSHLQGEVCSLECLAASVVLLEYAFEQSVIMMNQDIWQVENLHGIILS